VGLRHAFEPDHLAAVSTLVAEQRSSRAAALLGAVWGVGHSLALLVVVTLLGALGTVMSPALSGYLEFGVALMLMFLGARTLVKAARREKTGPVAPHTHGSLLHTHAFHAHDHVHVGSQTFTRQSLLVGLVHGLAGSGSLAALAAVEVSSMGGRILYVTLFGLGSIVGMALLSGIAGWPLARLASNPRLSRGLSFATGAFAIVVGFMWAWPTLSGS
jgi:ABC-type nickel/cobalt efflux system permease component RcnA